MAKSVVLPSLLAVVLLLVVYQLNIVKSDVVEGSRVIPGLEDTQTSILCDDEDIECQQENEAMATPPTTIQRQNPDTPTSGIPAISWENMEENEETFPHEDTGPKYSIGKPRFSGNSHMALPKLPYSARRSLELSVTFKASNRDGLLLYTGRTTEKQEDFLSLGLRKGVVELRFSNGDDVAVLRTTNNVTLGRWHKVVVFRDLRDGYLTLDYGELIRGSTNKNQQLMDLDTPLYLGGVPGIQTVSYSHGFHGCVKELVVDGKSMDLRYPGGEAIGGHNIDKCDKSQKTCQCQNQAPCQYTASGDPICACPLGTAGKHCEHELSLKIPSFNGQGYLSYPSTGDVASKSFTITVVLKPKAETGLIMLNLDHTNGEGDFFSLSLREGKVEFMFNCGSGAAVIRSRKPITIEQWHTITIWRGGSKGSLTLDDGLPVLGTSPGPLRHLSLNQNLFIGGMKDYKYQPHEIDMKSGFTGCIQKVTINFSPLDLTLPLSGVNVANCDHVCVTQSICLNGGSCHAEMNSFQCRCSIGYTGMLCDKRLKIKMPSFSGRSYLSYPSLGKEAIESFTITLVLRPRSDTGLVLYNGQHIDGKGDFISLALRKGIVEFMFDCGSGTALLRSKSKIFVDQWHTITIKRDGKKGQLILDDGLPVLGTSPGRFRHISLRDDLFLGGMRDYTQQPLVNAMKTGFIGCIQKVFINSKPLVLSSPRSGVNVHNCDHVCVTHQVCLNGGSCHAKMDSFKCHCASGYAGMMCDRAVRFSTHSFDGNSFVTITKKKILKRISGLYTNIALQLKTYSSEGQVLFVHQPLAVNSSYFSISLDNGAISVRYKKGGEQETVITTNMRIDDGMWHNILIKRTSSTFSIQTDDDVTKKELDHRHFLKFKSGKLFIGGLPSHLLTNQQPTSYQGNIRGLVIGGLSIDVTEESLIDVQARRYRISDFN